MAPRMDHIFAAKILYLKNVSKSVAVVDSNCCAHHNSFAWNRLRALKRLLSFVVPLRRRKVKPMNRQKQNYLR